MPDFASRRVAREAARGCGWGRETGREPVPVSHRKRMGKGGTGCDLVTPDVLKLLQKNPQSQTRRIRRVNRELRERLIKVGCRPIRPVEAARCFEPLP